MYPNDFYYTKDHEWVQVKGNQATVGITDFAQKQLGDVIYVELPAPGKKLESHQTIGVIESVKSVSDVFSPVSGEVVAINEELNAAADLVNKDPHGKGWIVRINLKNLAELDQLLRAADYEKYIEGLEA
jgi:glycine cleavage system H protein